MWNDGVRLRAWTGLICLLAGFASFAASEAQDIETPEELWIGRLVESMELVIADRTVAKHHVQSDWVLAMLSLGQHGRTETASKLLESLDNHGFTDFHEEGLSSLADGLSTGDHLDAAVETARSIQSPIYKERTLALVAIRQSQRGDFEDAERLLSLIELASERSRAAKQICLEYIELARFDEATRLAGSIEDTQLKSEVMEQLEKASARPKVNEPGYVEYQIQQAKSRPFGGASAAEIEFLEKYHRAEVALETQQLDQFIALAQDARDSADQMTDSDGCRLLLGRLFFKAGRNDEAQDQYQALLRKYAADKEDLASLDFNKLLFSHGKPSDARIVAQCVPESDLEKLVVRLISNQGSRQVGAAILGAVIRQNNPPWAETIARGTEPSLKLEIAANYLIQ